MSKAKWLRASAACLALPVMCSAAHAQAGDPAQGHADASDNASARDIVVTARRRGESLQHVPLSVSAVSSEQLAERSITDTRDLAKTAPGLTILDTPGRSSGLLVTLRSQAQVDPFATSDPSVGLYVDEIYIARPQGTNVGIFDLAQVQTLQGPQGTLFGRNTTGGAVLFTTQRPRQELGGSIQATAGNFDRQAVTAVLNIPLTDTLASRFGVYYNKRDGYYRSANLPFTGTSLLARPVVNQDLDDTNEFAARASLLFEPTSDISWFVKGEYQRIRNHGSAIQVVDAGTGTSYPAIGYPFQCFVPPNVGNGPTNPVGLGDCLSMGDLRGALAAQQAAGHKTVEHDLLQYSRINAYSLTSDLTFDMGPATLKLLTGYRKVRERSAGDLDGTSLSILQTGWRVNIRQISQELQLSGSAFDDRFDWQAGAYFFDERGLDAQDASFLFFGPKPGNSFFGTGGYRDSGSEVRNTSYSSYGQGTWRFSPTTRLTLGARVTHDRKVLIQRATDGAGTCVVLTGGVARNPCEAKLKAGFNGVSWNVSLDHDLSPDTLVYAATRRGLRSGGFSGNQFETTANPPFNPEKVTDGEVGVKTRFDLGATSARLRVAAFYADYKDIQRYVTRVDPVSGTPGTIVVNAGKGNIYGGELELNTTPVTGLDVNLGASVSIGRYKTFFFDDAKTIDLKDARFPNAPDFKFNGNIRYEIPIGMQGGFSLESLIFNIDPSYSSSYYATQSVNNVGINTRSGIRQKAFWNLDARVQLSGFGTKNASLALFGKNLTDRRVVVSSFDLLDAFGVLSATYAPPRTYGVELRWKFGGE